MSEKCRVSVYPLYDEGLTATQGTLCAFAEGTLAEAMADAGRQAEAWTQAPSEEGESAREPFGFNVRVLVASRVDEAAAMSTADGLRA